MRSKKRLTLFMRTGLLSLCLITLLSACATTQTEVVYVSTPLTSNLELLCKPKLPPPLQKPAKNEDLALYAQNLQGEIKECAKQQAEYRAEMDRLLKRARSRLLSQ
ncbi:MAG: Rz1-like lysis system protein LysC [Casimicrobium sp.]